MIHVAAFSGGKDSTAVILWLREQGIEHRTIFCDTGFEHQITLDYIKRVDAQLGLNLEVLRSTKYPGGFEELCIKKKMFPNQQHRFCTLELKLVPMWEWIEAQDDDVTLYQGIRAEESPGRAAMEPREYVNEAGGYSVERPIFRWPAEQVFEIHAHHGVEPNPLYLMGFHRVGCAPCIMANKPELRQWALRFPEIRARIEELEARLNEEPGKARRAYFRADKIPERFKRSHARGDIKVPTAAEVFDYVTEIDRKQLSLLDEEPSRCMSVYNLCE
jgi:3'-phosphoadenosine 5'-phosphosulfate sulfotransferase (PAPS reductase)/FAD synthetase